MPVARQALADDPALQPFERGEERRGPVPHLVMGLGAATALLERQPGLGAIQGLNLTFLIDAQNHGLVRRIEIDTHNVGELLDKALVAGKLEGASQVGLESVQLPDALHALEAHAFGFGHRAATPVGSTLGLGVEGRAHHRGHLAPAQGRFATPTGGDLGQGLRPALEKAFLPKPDRRLTDFQGLANGFAAFASVCQQDDPASPHDALAGFAGFHQTLEWLNLRWSGCNG